MNQFYVQDDWRIRHGLTLSIGLRYSLETAANTQYGLKSAFNPNATDPLTGLKGGITHPAGGLYSSNLHNLTPRIGLAWNFRPQFVFRGSFGMFTQDLVPALAQDEYTAQAVVRTTLRQSLPGILPVARPGANTTTT